jgi:hypothetical protein
LTSLAVSSTVQVSMTPENDRTGAGVDWNVTCGGSPTTGSITGGACGTLSPAHTPGGTASIYTAPALIPIGNTVTIAASVTSDPSAVSSITLKIVSLPISVHFVLAPQSVGAGATASYAADVVNDITSAGAAWTVSCGSQECGSFTPKIAVSGSSTLYTAPTTAPANGIVTVTATSIADSSKSVSVKVTILSIAVDVEPKVTYVKTSGKTRAAQLIATVTNDTADKGVDWTVSCGTPGNCGAITPHTSSGVPATFVGPVTIPSGGTVTIAAAATSDPAKKATATASIISSTPISIAITSPPPAALAEGQATTLVATVANDPKNLGVNWSAVCSSASACGTFSLSSRHTASGGAITYMAPAAVPSGGVVTITAMSPASTPANPAYASTTITAVAPTIAYLQQPPSNLQANAQAKVSAVVTNDVAPGGVTWTVQCTSSAEGGCGYVLPYQTASGDSATYVAPPTPPGGQVEVVASSTSAPTVSAASTPVTISASTALSIRFIPFAPTNVQTGVSVYLNAAVSNDSTEAGVDWQVCASGCGFFTITPAIPAVPATSTTPYIPAVPAVTATTVKAWRNGLPILYTAPSAEPQGGALTIAATAHAGSGVSAVSSVAVNADATGPTLHGVVKAGTEPVVGAFLSLYAAGTSGYGSASTLIYAPSASPFAKTDKTGSFTLSSGYSCPAPSRQMYLVATGGQVGANAANSNLSLMTALGPCSNLSSSAVVLNEVTTVASAWALAPFAANDALNGNNSYLNIGASKGNATGLANAFASVSNLVDVTTGQALFSVPAGNAVLPYAEIDTLADILNACTASGGGSEGDGTPCGTLFADADPLSYNPEFHSTPPTDTIQAAVNIAQHPEGSVFGYQINVSDLYTTLSSLGSPFQPILTSTPNDLSISLNFTGGGGLSSASQANYFSLDGAGNLWVTDTAGNRVIEWNNQGVAISPAGGFIADNMVSPGPVAVDTAGNVWVCGANGLTELDSLATQVTGSPFTGGGLASKCQGMAIDGSNDIWIVNGASVSKFTSLGVPVSPAAGYVIPVSPTSKTSVSLLPPIAIDGSNNVWVGVNTTIYPGLLSLAELSGSSGQPNYLSPEPLSASPSNFVDSLGDPGQTQIAIDGSGDVWVPSGTSANSGALNKVLPYQGTGTTDQTAAGYNSNSGGIDALTYPRGVAIDGAGMVWVGSEGGTDSQLALSPGLTEIGSSSSTAYSNYVSQSLTNQALSVTVDGSGNIWVLLDNNTITEFVGLATPAVTPLSLGVETRKLGKKP